MRSKSRLLEVALRVALSMPVLAAGPVLPAVAADDAQARGELEEVVVTARKREEALIDVPLSITVLDPVQIEQRGIQNVTDLYGRVPSLFYAQNRNFSSNRDFQFMVVRGVGANPALEPSVGVFIDGVYQPGLGFDTSFLDVERVELLRGPQGALFGRNTEGGALNIVTRKPGDEMRGSVSLQADDLPSAIGRASLSGPVVPGKLYAGVAAQGVSSDGWIKNTYLGADQNSETGASVRLALRYTPTEDLEINLTADDTTRRGKSMGIGVPESAGKSYDVAFEFPSDFDTHYAGAALSIDYNFGGMRLTSQTGYRHVKTQYGLDFDEGPVLQGNFQFYNGEQRVVSEELRLASTSDAPIQWLVGAYVFRQREKSSLVSNWGSFFGPDLADGVNQTGFERDGYAFFGNVTYTTPGGLLDLTAGLRYAKEDADATRFSRLTIPAFGLNVTRDTPRSAKFEDTSPNVQATLNWTDKLKTYANVAKGFKSGGWERIPTSTSPFLTLEPERAWNYEVGLKGDRLADRLSFSLAFYRVELKNMHTPTLIVNPETGLQAATIASAGKAHTTGVELEGTLNIVEGLDLSVAGSYTKAKFDEFTDTTGADRGGDRLPNVPKWLFRVGLDYSVPLAGGRTFVASGSVRHVGKYFSGLGTPTDAFQTYDSYEVFDLDVGVNFERFRVGLFVRNLADKYIITSKDFNQPGTEIVRQLAPPRTFGIRAAYDFN